MTVITAVHDTDNACVWVGSNSRATLGSIAGPPTDKKWVPLGPWLVGVTGTGPKPEAIEAIRSETDAIGDRAVDIVKLLKKAYEIFDIGETDEGLKRYCGSGIIVHKSAAIWDFDDSFCLSSVPSGMFWARGSGMDMAIGAGRALESLVQSKKDITARVVEIVIANDIDCPGEPVIQKFDAEGKLSFVRQANANS